MLSNGTVKVTNRTAQVREHFAIKFEDGHVEGQFTDEAAARVAAGDYEVWTTVVRYKMFIDTTTVMEITLL